MSASAVVGKRPEDALEIVGPPELVRLEPDAQSGRPPLRLLEGQDAPGVVGVVDQRDARELRRGLPEQFQPLAVFRADERDVAAGARVARDEARLIGEGDAGEHDRDRGRRLLGRPGGRPARGAEDVHGETNELRRELGEALDAPIGPAGLDGDGLALDVPDPAQSGPQGLQVREAVGGRGG